MSTRNLCFEQKYEKYQSFYLKIFKFLEVKFSVYLNRHVFVMLFKINDRRNESSNNFKASPASILYKSIAGRYRPVCILYKSITGRYPDR